LEKEGIECTKKEMRIAAEGHITTEALMWNQNINQKTISGMVVFLKIICRFKIIFKMYLFISDK